jgi:hypothetical protein
MHIILNNDCSSTATKGYANAYQPYVVRALPVLLMNKYVLNICQNTHSINEASHKSHNI